MSNFIIIQNQSRLLRLSFTRTIFSSRNSTGQEENLPIHRFSSESSLSWQSQWSLLMGCSRSPYVQPWLPLSRRSIWWWWRLWNYEEKTKEKEKSFPSKTPCISYSSESHDDPSSSHPLPMYKKALKWIEKEDRKTIPQESIFSQPKLRSCLMFSSSNQSY